jgi:CBS domain-containing protein
MKRHAPSTRDYMSHLPLEFEHCEFASDALAMMDKRAIHHLPVMSGSHLRGIITRQGLLEAKTQLGKDFATTPLHSICQTGVLTVSPMDPIDEVCRQLLARRADLAVVMDGGFVVGVFTSTDVLRFVADHFGSG